MKLSGFTFIHNALAGGYPIVEAIQAVQPYVDEIVVVDMESTDGTTKLLKQFGVRDAFLKVLLDPSSGNRIITEMKERFEVRIIPGKWGRQAGETLAAAHALHRECAHEMILHFEADEVYDESLLWEIRELVEQGATDLAVYRLQLEQNFQRCRWHPEAVQRVFRRGTVTKQGHTTDRHATAQIIDPAHGFLWDITNCFRDNWLQRVEQQAELWHGRPQYIMVPLHTLHEARLDEEQARELLEQPHWEWTKTPFAIPEILKPLVGQTKYEARL